MFETLSNLATGFDVALRLPSLVVCFLGVLLGTTVGAIPGIGALTAISLCLPITYYMEPLHGIIMLSGIFYGAQYGSSIASILLNIPGTPSAAVTCLDGYPMARNGRAGPALLITTIASFIGGTIAIMLLVFLSQPLAKLALTFRAADYFSIMILGLVAASTISIGSHLKGLTMVTAGLLLGMIGTDITSGTHRLTFSFVELSDGLSLVAVAMGLFGIGELLSNIALTHSTSPIKQKVRLRELLPSRIEIRESGWPILRGTTVGSWIGALPGAGPAIAAFMAYAVEKRISKNPGLFGRGAVAGIAAPEAANNAAVQSAFIPTLCIGVPGDAVMAFMLSALIIHGITPGPQFIASEPDLFWALVASFWVGNVLLLVLNIPFIGFWVRILSIPKHLLYPSILFFICIGVYSVNNNVFDVYIALIFGVVGFFLNLYNYPTAPVILGFILGPMIEENFRRALFISDGDFSIFMATPYSAVALAATFALLLFQLIGFKK